VRQERRRSRIAVFGAPRLGLTRGRVAGLDVPIVVAHGTNVLNGVQIRRSRGRPPDTRTNGIARFKQDPTLAKWSGHEFRALLDVSRSTDRGWQHNSTLRTYDEGCGHRARCRRHGCQCDQRWISSQ
jgi:hypothetical protein